MTEETDPGIAFFFGLLLLKRRSHKANAARIRGQRFHVLVVGKAHDKFRDEVTTFPHRLGNVTKTGKKKARRVTRADGDVAVGTNQWRRTLARKELLAMTSQTRSVFGKFSDVGKRRLALADVFPILRGKLVAGVAYELFHLYVRTVGKVCVVDERLL